MKKLISLLCILIMVVFSFSLAACKDKTVVIDGDYIVITVEIKNIDEGGTLKDYMDYLKVEDKFTYEIKDGMIKTINGKSGNTNQYWMLYTNDTENANNTWGTCIYKETTYGSASLGAESLVVKDGYIYIWYLQTF